MLPGVLHTLFLPCGGLLVQRMSPTTMTGLGLLRRVQSHNDVSSILQPLTCVSDTDVSLDARTALQYCLKVSRAGQGSHCAGCRWALGLVEV
ncbi:hypothetical protein IWX49DRAFT_422306 [Phyllosticta citricarpa]|uniref:Secreted protein n=1 Tax=Phyllosticta citricarpa TaxID=55181 RepID=A0ABR1ME15_9PEZI